MPRTSPDGSTLLYVLNHSGESVNVTLPDGRFHDLLSGAEYEDMALLEKNGVLILAVHDAA